MARRARNAEIKAPPVEPVLKDQLLAAIPSLRAFAFSLTNSWDRTDDLVQETMIRAWIGLDRFQRGTNLEAWLFTILRNFLYSEYRKRRREVEDVDGFYSSRLTISPEQQPHLDLKDLSQALQKLPLQHREALLLIAAEDLSYEESAAICDIPIGTLKSRVSRGREKLAQLLAVIPIKDHRLDQVTRAVVQSSWPFITPVEHLINSAATQISFQNTGADSERSRKSH